MILIFFKKIKKPVTIHFLSRFNSKETIELSPSVFFEFFFKILSQCAFGCAEIVNTHKNDFW